MSDVRIIVEGLVQNRLALTSAELAALDTQHQVPDVGQIVPGRQGRGVMLRGLLRLAGPMPEADYLTLHSETDDFHASVPLAAVVDSGVLVYELSGQPLPIAAGGPIRFLLPNTAACHTAEVDECANVKFVNRIELSAGRGRDNRPSTLREHQKLHEAQQKPPSH